MIKRTQSYIINKNSKSIRRYGQYDKDFKKIDYEMMLCIDTTNACNLKCATCYRGRGDMLSDNETMSLDFFQKIIKKAVNEGFDKIGLYNWAEPFLNPKIDEYVKTVKDYNLTCEISTNLSLPRIPHLERTLNYGVDNLYVTVSGDDNQTHSINHRGSDIDVVKAHLNKISELKKNKIIKTHVTLIMLNYSYNEHCIESLRKYADSLGMDFYLMIGSGDPLESDGKIVIPKLSVPFGTIKGGKCVIMDMNVPIDHKGNIYLCCARPNHKEYLIGNFLEMSLSEIFVNRICHPFCRKCFVETVELNNQEKGWIINAFDKNVQNDKEHSR